MSQKRHGNARRALFEDGTLVAHALLRLIEDRAACPSAQENAMMQQMWAGVLALTALAIWPPESAYACGGFFCSASPVDQNAERIVFAVDEQSQTTDMIVQIAYQGADDAFAWVLPVGSVPQKREVFPNEALAPLDAQTGPMFVLPSKCRSRFAGGAVSGPGGGDDADESAADDGVVVHVQETVGPFEVAVIESESADATFSWLLQNKYRLSSVMKPYIELYTRDKMKFLALRLTANATVQDIQPFKMTLPGTTPSIPLRLTAIAAEPEMGILVWVLGARRYEPANAEEITIPKAELRYRLGGREIRTNWTELVARHVDERGGRGWVVEQAGSSAQIASFLQNTFTSTPAQMEAKEALLTLFAGRPYMTRLYTRIAAEEMGYDPSFRQSDKPDVNRQIELPYIEAACTSEEASLSIDECDFASCGQLGVCRAAMNPATKSKQAACACAPGTTARTTFDPQGAPIVSCQDQRMSFMNPGESDEMGSKFADPCVGFSCGEHGRCVSMNMTPTCECNEGYVAIGSVDGARVRKTECVTPLSALPMGFYNRRPPMLAEGMTAGRAIVLPAVSGTADRPMPDRYGEPMIAPAKPIEAPKQRRDDGCSVSDVQSDSRASRWLLALVALALTVRRRRLA
jgi:MYXO-CTERM domain-containing protein